MNYIRQMKAFYDRLETHPLSTAGIVLWHALMAIANQAGWPETFYVSTTVLQQKTGGLSRDSIERARGLLEEQGLISWRRGRARQPAVYALVDLRPIGPLIETSEDENVTPKDASQSDVHDALMPLTAALETSNLTANAAHSGISDAVMPLTAALETRKLESNAAHSGISHAAPDSNAAPNAAHSGIRNVSDEFLPTSKVLVQTKHKEIKTNTAAAFRACAREGQETLENFFEHTFADVTLDMADREQLGRWIETHGVDYVREKIVTIAARGGIRKPFAALVRAVAQNWQSSPRASPPSAPARERHVPPSQAGKYARFWELYQNKGL